MADFSLLKAKILAAGAIFCILAALPIIFAARAYGFFGLFSGATKLKSTPKTEWIVDCTIIVGLYIATAEFVAVVGSLFVSSFLLGSQSKMWSIVLTLWMVIWVISVALAAKWQPIYPKSYLILTLLLAMAVAATLAKGYEDRFWVAGWFYGWELVTIFLMKKSQDGGFWKKIEWERLFAIPLILVSCFAKTIYSKILPSYGGGSPQRVVIYLSPDAPKVLQPSPLTAWLIDESDHGYYILRTEDAKRAVYVPRDVTKTLEYLALDVDDDRPKRSGGRNEGP